MDHSNHTPLRADEISAMNLDGANIYGPDDSNIGDVAHTHGTGPATSVIMDVGGFLGLGARRVSIPVSQLNFMRNEDGDVHATTTMTKDQLKALPEHHD